MRAHHRIGFPRELHPGAWWVWALALAGVAAQTTNPVVGLLLVSVTGVVYAARAGDTPWAAAYPMFLRLGLVVLVIHVLVLIVLAGDRQGSTVLFTLPGIPLPEGSGVRLGGDVTAEAVVGAVLVALQILAILCCLGAANALGSARRLLGYLPAALYEVGIALTIALTVAPQLADDARRIREASRLRGGDRGRLHRLTRTAMPLLEGALERSVDLAAAMDARGYGRATATDPVRRRVTSALVLLGLLGVCLGLYGALGGTSNTWFGVPTLIGGVVLAVVGLAVAGRRSGRTRYRTDPWGLPEWVVVGAGGLALGATVAQAMVDPVALQGRVDALPQVPVLACLGVLGALGAAVLAPSPGTPSPERSDPERSDPERSDPERSSPESPPPEHRPSAGPVPTTARGTS